MELLTEYTHEVGEKISKAADRLAKQAQKELGEVSPKHTGKYAKSWHLKRFGESGSFRIVLHNSEYRLPHLLENGVEHHYPNDSHVDPKVHIAPVQDKLNDAFFKECEKIIKEEK